MNRHSPYASADTPALPLHLLDREGYAAWRAVQPEAVSAWLDAQAFVPSPGTVALLPGAAGVAWAVCGIGDRLDPCSYAHAPLALPPADLHMTTLTALADWLDATQAHENAA